MNIPVKVTVWHEGIPFNTTIICPSLKAANKAVEGMVHILSHGKEEVGIRLSKSCTRIKYEPSLKEWSVEAFYVKR